MPPCTHSFLDLIPRMIPRNYCRESRVWNSKEENYKIQCKIDGSTCFRSCFSVTNWKGKEALTSLSISSLNSFCSLAKMFFVFLELFCHLFLFFYLPKVACGVNTLKFEVKWCHLITSSKWLPCNSCKNEVMLFFYWLMLPNCLLEWLEPRWPPQQGKKDAETRILQIRAATKGEGREKRPLLPVHPLLQPKRPSMSRGNHKENCRGRATQGGREVTFIIADWTVGPDGWGGWAIYVL